MPAVASVPKELYLSSSLKDLNKKTEVKPEKISTKKTTFILYLDLQTSKKLLKKLRDSLKALNSDMKKLKFGKNLKKRTDRRRSSCRNRKSRKQKERMIAHQIKVLWKMY